jgi:cellulose synthase (UDP-forming)
MSVKSVDSTEIRKEIRITHISLSITLVICVLLGWDLIGILSERLVHGEISGSFLQLVFITTISFLLYGSFVYHLSRLGYLKRTQIHQPKNLEILESIYEKQAPSLAVLVPSYKEDTQVITKTLLSVALLNYPSKQVVLLIDNPPAPDKANDRELLDKTRELPQKIQAMLEIPACHFRREFNAFVHRQRNDRININTELTMLARLYTDAADWLECFAGDYVITNHEDEWFVKNILLAPAQQHLKKAADFEKLARDDRKKTSEQRLYREYCRLSRLFQVKITSFERKRYVNLSHEPNKAMNINSYLSLMGNNVIEEASNDGVCLVSGDKNGKGVYIPDADFIITLDADSVLLPDYALTLVDVMQQSGNERLAVAQTPYSAFPGATTKIERIAGATTDIQYLVHQGFTYFNATFWVGANALLRKVALEDIVTVECERGYEVRKYIQDRTVIEDTESSVDLVDRDWQLYNYPMRMAYSATPPDFGSLLIQRRRWANGGLIILPKFLRHITGCKDTPRRIMRGLLGGHYLTSLAGANLGIMILLLWPFEEAMRTQWLPLAVIPYFIIYARDLVQTGYRVSDVFRVSALSLLLVPVNLGGVFKSLQQILTGKRTPFGRTPKISDRTAVPLVYLAAVYGFTTYCMISFIMDMQAARWMHATFSIINGGILAYAISRFIGLRESLQDAGLAFARSKQLHIEPMLHMATAQTSVMSSEEMVSSGKKQA